MFYTGQRVVCVDAENTNTDGRQELIEGAVYTVVGVGEDVAEATSRYGLRGLCLWLAGVRRRYGRDVGFAVARFRPLCEPKTDIEIFRKALTDDLIGEEA